MGIPMYRFEKLTKYIPLLDQTEIGNWVIDTENDGTIEHPIQFPFVAHSSLVSNFIDDVSGFVEDNPELHLNRYPDILEESGLEWSTQSMSGAIAEDLDAKVVCALIVGAVRAERFCDGALLNFFTNGSMMRWLHRLQEIGEHTNNIFREKECSQ